ncbi:MAG: thiol:disulfide interchange protein DsbA/DsbL [Steroidobacteraceae bacterium]
MLARALLLIALLAPLPALAQLKWEEGRNFTVIPGGMPTGLAAGKIEVAEVFSYGCIHCYRAKDQMAKLQASLPPDAAMVYVHASFLPAEAWPMFQRAWYTAQALGIGAPAHDQFFAAVWETGEIPLLEQGSGNIRKPLPTIDDAARFYARVSAVKAPDFLKLANSPEIDAEVAKADAQVKAWRIPGTPSLVVNGHYLVDNGSVSSWDELRQLVLFLVDRERQRQKQPALAKP